MTVVPVVTLTVSQYAGIFSEHLRARPWRSPSSSPGSLMRSGRCRRRKAPIRRRPRSNRRSRLPLIGTAIVLPLMLVYLLFGLTDAIPVLLTTVLLVAKMEEERGAASGWAKLLGNFLGGFVAVAAYYLLQIAPSLATLALITFIIGFGFALQIVERRSARRQCPARLQCDDGHLRPGAC